MAYIKAPQGREQEHYDFLEDLRQSGKTNMFVAAIYLQGQFGLDKGEAKAILLDWMKGHSDPTRKMDGPGSVNPPKAGRIITRYEPAKETN